MERNRDEDVRLVENPRGPAGAGQSTRETHGGSMSTRVLESANALAERARMGAKRRSQCEHGPETAAAAARESSRTGEGRAACAQRVIEGGKRFPALSAKGRIQGANETGAGNAGRGKKSARERVPCLRNQERHQRA